MCKLLQQAPQQVGMEIDTRTMLSRVLKRDWFNIQILYSSTAEEFIKKCICSLKYFAEVLHYHLLFPHVHLQLVKNGTNDVIAEWCIDKYYDAKSNTVEAMVHKSAIVNSLTIDAIQKNWSELTMVMKHHKSLQQDLYKQLLNAQQIQRQQTSSSTITLNTVIQFKHY